MNATAEYETFTAPGDVWEPIISMCLKHTKFNDLSSMRADMDERIDRYLTEEFGPEGWQPAGLGARSEAYERSAFLKVLRQPQECRECRAGKRVPEYCDSGGKIFEVFKQAGKIYVWYRPGLCQDWLRSQARKQQTENVPVETGRRGFGR